MLTMKGKYGLKAMLHLARLPAGERALSEEIATAHNISKKFLDAILADLRLAGLVHARKGRGGGYLLAQDSSQIRIGQILRVLDGPLAPIPCASRTAYRRCDDCRDERSCAVRRMMLEVRNAISAVLDDKTLAEAAGSFTEHDLEFRELAVV
ncbi:RrF2 family transcriptional regulator [Aureimonas jatrophae]|jgi:Rrf2 family protein|uniref:Rrf2 family protein n=1 Tax=Aureimonas jatrophae TaxID=1166073 RepID=A0A1H0GQX9_9HYPH|nr:Rrf2 family transcriptional regulator [Aureimonas jatrophae]MBB3949705.1 Rrf2 family protein [Aureimonas jatrophae]SDO09111.1 Rrf2 family protein [Aureimonas jatrophae]